MGDALSALVIKDSLPPRFYMNLVPILSGRTCSMCAVGMKVLSPSPTPVRAHLAVGRRSILTKDSLTSRFSPGRPSAFAKASTCMQISGDLQMPGRPTKPSAGLNFGLHANLAQSPKYFSSLLFGEKPHLATSLLIFRGSCATTAHRPAARHSCASVHGRVAVPVPSVAVPVPSVVAPAALTDRSFVSRLRVARSCPPHPARRRPPSPLAPHARPSSTASPASCVPRAAAPQREHTRLRGSSTTHASGVGRR